MAGQVTVGPSSYQTGQRAHTPVLKHQDIHTDRKTASTNQPKRKEEVFGDFSSLTRRLSLPVRPSSPPQRGAFQVIQGYVR